MPSSLYDPSKILSGSQLLAAAKQLVALQTKPQEQSYARLLAQSQAMGAHTQAQTAGYYQRLAHEAASQLAAGQAIGGRLNTTLAGIGQQTQGAIGAAGAQAQGGLAQSVASGLAGGGDTRLAQELAAQRGIAANTSGAAQTAGALQGANYGQLSASQGATGLMRGQESLGQLAQSTLATGARIQGKQADLAGTKAALLADTVGKLRDSEFSKLATQQTLGLKSQAQDTASSAVESRAAAAATTAQISVARLQQQAAKAAKGDALATSTFIAKYGHSPEFVRAHPAQAHKDAVALTQKTKSGFLTPAGQEHQWAQVGSIVSLINTGKTLKDASGKALTEHTIRQNLLGGTNPKKQAYPAWIVNIAMDIAYRGGLSAPNVRALHAHGIQLKGRYPKVGAPVGAPSFGGTPLTGAGVGGTL